MQDDFYFLLQSLQQLSGYLTKRCRVKKDETKDKGRSAYWTGGPTGNADRDWDLKMNGASRTASAQTTCTANVPSRIGGGRG